MRLFWCQFFSAFGDNFLKTALVFLILFHIAGGNAEALITLAGATLIAPFFFLSGIGGELADRFDKAMVAQRLKFVEIGVAALAVAGFAFHSITLLFIAVGMYGTIASLFGPIKYGILPDHLKPTELQPAMRWSRAAPSSPSCSAPSSPGLRQKRAATRSTSPG